MKTSLFISALAALPSFISAFSIYSDLYVRDVYEPALSVRDVYEPALSIRDAIPYLHIDNDAFEIVMRSLEARFIDAIADTAAYIARRDIEDDLFYHKLDRRTPESDAYHQTQIEFDKAAAAYIPIANSQTKSCEDKIAAAEKALDLAKSVLQQRKAAAKKYNDHDSGHQHAIKVWQSNVQTWQKNVSQWRFSAKCKKRNQDGGSSGAGTSGAGPSTAGTSSGGKPKKPGHSSKL